jgi:four helix bundle protein
VRDFTELKVWRKAHELTLDVYRVTKEFPSEERFGLVQQLRRAAASVPTNVAEGAGRHTESDFARFLDIAAGSISETIYHLMLSRDLLLIEPDAYGRLVQQVTAVRKMIGSLAATVRSRTTKS